MSIREICRYPAPVLREPTETIHEFDGELKKLVEDMWETMYASDGIGLAAPQVGVPKKVIVIDYNGEKYALVNPEIISREGSVTNEEGCLSFPGIYVNVDAPERMDVRYCDESGEAREISVDGFLACVFSHEIDHLNGRLLIDRVSPLRRQFMKKRLAKDAKSGD
ncbi:MAG: peptide deformylase [Synergistaceae bacterium]|nr:peptide deformylase [Synergistaceae bacterium]